jgi:hypothetical protein
MQFVSKPGTNRWEGLVQIDFLYGLGDRTRLGYGIRRLLKSPVAVETGAVRGKAICYIGMARRQNGSGRLYALDAQSPRDWNDDPSIDTFGIMRALKKLGLTETVAIACQYSSRVVGQLTQADRFVLY